MKYIIHLVVCILISQSFVAQNGFVKDSLDVYITREMKRWNFPGMAVAVVKDGKVIFMKGYGYSNLEQKTPVTENTVFQIASNSKAFTGTSLALLEYYKKLSLEDKVIKYLPYFKMNENWKTNEVTIADMLSHRIGYETFQTDFLNWNSTKTRKELIENMANVTPKFNLREKYGYCNMGFLTAGEIIPAACDTSWDDYLKYHYFLPLGMSNTHTTYSEFIKQPGASKAYSLVNDKVEEITPANVDNLGPAASITSSVNDLSKWMIMQLNNGKYEGKQIVPEQVIQRTRESFMIVNPKSRKGNNFSNYGLGWFLNDAHGKKVVTHDGGANGFLSKTVLIPEDNFGFVILTNSDAQYLFEALGNQIIAALTLQPYRNLCALYYNGFMENHEEEKTEIAALKKTAAAYRAPAGAYVKVAGVYANKVYGQIAIEAKDNHAEVSFEFHPQYKARIRFLTPTTMILEYSDATLGTKEIAYTEKGPDSTIEIKVTDFIDPDPYLFTKVNRVYKPFTAK
jgi:CubicO group peptidase (beta-lactamase class C family)